MTHHRRKFFVAAASCLLAAITPAAAVSVGDTVSCSATVFSCTGTNVIGSGVEYTYGIPGFFTALTLDFTNDQLTVNSVNGAFGGSITLKDLTNPITAYQLLSTGNTTFSASNLNLGSDGSLTLNLAGLVLNGGSQIQIGLSSATSAVPEGSTWAMMIGGFGLMGASMRRRRPAASLLTA